jgi:hypothetical protein
MNCTKGVIVLIFFLFLYSQLFSQSIDKKEKNNMLIGTALSPIFSEVQLGTSIEFNYFINYKYFTGLYFFSNRTATNDTFGYNIKQPIINFVEIGWNNGIQFYNKKRIKLAVSLSNNLCLVRLGDNSEKTSIFTGKVIATTPKEIRTDYLYSLVPNIGASFQIYSTLFLSTNIKYRQTFSSSFAGMTPFNGFVYGVGLTFFLD